jgi:glyoxylase-like metal-dependent hydrolase (beta-lactamase superfamily II)
MKRLLLVSVWLTLISVIPALAQQPQGPPRRSITRIAGDLYRVQNNDHYTVFLVTPAGIILADPINVEAAAWIKAQLTERFPNAPVRYVLYSHHHQDHASGAAVFNDTAELVAHESFVAGLKASAGANEAAAKRFAAVMPPESTYKDRRTITLGGKSVEMVHPGRMGHAPDMTVLVFPAERVLFGVDFVNVKTVPGSNTLANGAPIAEYVNALKVVEALDFDVVAPGHGPMGKKADLAEHRQYYEKLAAGVAAGIAKGQTLEQIQAAKIMDEYRDWIEYDEDNDINIANAYKTLSAQKR